MVKNMKIIKYIIKRFYFKHKYNANVYTGSVNFSIKLGDQVEIQKNTVIGNVSSIGDYTYICENSIIFSGKIGKYCSISQNVCIGPPNHPYELVSTHPFLYDNRWAAYMGLVPSHKIIDKTPPIIGNDVWIGRNSIIMEGITIGDGAVIGAGSIVTKDVAPYTIVAGVPAKLIKNRFSKEMIEKLLELKWWEDSQAIIKDNYHFFSDPSTFIKYYKTQNSKVDQ